MSNYQWSYDNRGHEEITPADVEQEQRELDALIRSLEFPRTFEIVSLPLVWPFR